MQKLHMDDVSYLEYENEIASEDGKKLIVITSLENMSLSFEVRRKSHFAFTFDDLQEALDFYNKN